MTLCCGPRTKEGGVCCLELTRELLIKKINDPQFPFGHDYVVGATIMGNNFNLLFNLNNKFK